MNCDRGFIKTNEIYRLVYHKTNTILDLLPYGEIEQNHTINFDQRDMELSVLGFKEVGEQVENIHIKEAGFTLPTSPVVGLIILKLISWNDKLDREYASPYSSFGVLGYLHNLLVFINDSFFSDFLFS